MAEANSCPSEADLKLLAQGEAAPKVQAILAQHVDGCARCQAVLDRLSGARDSWSDAARHLGSALADPALAQAMDNLAAQPPNETTADSSLLHDVKLSFLGPPAQPGHIGTLAHYDILEVVGKGGMGIVLKANDTKLQRIVAIKVMRPELAADAAARQRFTREARAAAAVTHDHVVTIHGVAEDHSPPYLVMQFVAGRSLQHRIDETGALEVKEILRIGMQAASGLAAAHAQGLVHRDIKPANILLENGIERVKITDFGLARAGDDPRVTRTGVVTGTPQYMSPEQAHGRACDHRADLFSLGGVMYAMCTGYAPFRASSSMAVLKKVCDEIPRAIHELNAEIPDWLVTIVEKLMAKEPSNRFQSASEVASLLGQHLAHLQQPSVFPAPDRRLNAEAGRSKSAGEHPSLLLPALLLLSPFVLGPVAAVLVYLFSQAPAGEGLASSPMGLLFALIGVVGVGVFLIGFVLLVVRLSRRGSPAWLALLVVACLGLFACPVPIMIGFIISFAWASDRSMPQHQGNDMGTSLDARPGEPEDRTTLTPIRDAVRDADAKRRIGETVLMHFTNDKKPITSELESTAVKPDAEGWVLTNSVKTYTAEDYGPRVRLFEVLKPEVAGHRVTVRCKIRSEKVAWARIYMRDDEDTSKVLVKGRRVEGTTNWTEYEFSSDLPIYTQCPRLAVDASLSTGFIWIKDLEMVKEPMVDGAELLRLQGTWMATQGQRDGVALTPEQIQKWRLVVKGNRFSGVTESGEFQLDARSISFNLQPMRYITARVVDGSASMDLLYELTGDTLKVCCAGPGVNLQPLDFSPKNAKEPGRWVVTFRRANK